MMTFDRPSLPNREALTTTPAYATMIALLGAGQCLKGVALSKTEYANIRKIYGFEKEGPNVKPPRPEVPEETDYPSQAEFLKACKDYKEDLKAWDKWKDPQVLMQAGADRNMLRYAERDGLRLLAWLAKFVEAGEDPVKVLINMAVEAGYDVDPADVTYAPDGEDDE